MGASAGEDEKRGSGSSAAPSGGIDGAAPDLCDASDRIAISLSLLFADSSIEQGFEKRRDGDWRTETRV